MPTGSRHPQRAECCRCGYDLRGVVSAWTDRCPIDGVCAECGLQFQWAELLSETIGGPGWCLEFARSHWDFLRRAAKTLAMTFRPWSFWGTLRMQHPVRWRPLVVYIAAIVIAFYVMFCLGQGALAFQQWYGWRNPTFPIVPVHYSTYEIFHAALLPLSDRAPAPAAAPALYLFFSPRDLCLHYWSSLFKLGLGFLLFHALCPAGFLALPISQRMTKVRWSHVIRAAVYGVALMVPAGVLAAVASALSGTELFNPSTAGRWLLLLAAMATVAVLPMEIVWWSVASGRYMKLRHPWGVGVAVVVMAALATMLLFAVPSL